jgi:imidazolonepropionase-like amidohydrolase
MKWFGWGRVGLVASEILVVIALASGVRAAQETVADVAVRASNWVDLTSGVTRGAIALLVKDGNIAKIVAGSEFDPKSARTVLDLGRATLLPGLVDAHVHLQMGGQPAENATAALRAGFTTLVDLGATSDVVLRLRDAMLSGSMEGPRILAAGLWAGTKNGICEFGGIGISGGPEGFRRRVRDNVTAGADLIKVCVSAWVPAALASPDAYEITDDALVATVDESTRAKRMVIAHAISLGAAKAAARAGVAGLAHAAFLDAATANELRERDVFVISTLTTLTQRPGPQNDALKAAVLAAQRAGVRVVFGTDGGVLPHGKNAAEFRALTLAGLSPLETLRAATTNAALALGLQGKVGALAEGLPADIIAVDGDPLADIDAMKRILFVMRNGRVIVERSK